MRRLALLVVAVALAGCGTSVAAQPPAASPPTVGVSLTTAGADWAVLVMGGSAASENNFWQLFARTSGRWSLVTPPGVADNGGLVVAGAGTSLLAGIRPSQGLEFSPLATSSDHGVHWTAGLLDAALADVPDALAVSGARKLALLNNQTTEQTSPGGTRWSILPGPPCGPSAVTFTPSDAPLVGGDCGVFRYSGGAWRSAGPPVSGRVLRLTATGNGNAALLLSGGDLYAAWTSDGGARWSVSAPLALDGATVSSATLGSSVGVLLSSRHAFTVGGGGTSWTALPTVPAGTAVLALDPVQALAVTGGSRLSVWQLASVGWARTQSITVPIGYGSSS